MAQKKIDSIDIKKVAEEIRAACIEAAREGFREAAMSGLCTEGAIEAAVSAIQMMDLNKAINTGLTPQNRKGKASDA